MKIKRGILAGAVVAGVIAVGGAAFTATSTIDDGAINVGPVSQTVSGATFTNVVHTYTAATDTTTAVSAKAEQLISESDDVVTVSVNGGAAQDCTVAQTDADLDGVDDGGADFSDVECDIADLANVTSLQFVVNG